MTQHYSDYLQLDKILNAQSPVSAQVGHEKHEEMLFIIVHQAHELWFKQILFELDAIISLLSEQQIDDSKMLTLVKWLQRICVIENLLIDQITVLDTMTPMDFLEFRDLVVPASGFQSLQFRMIEIKLGIERSNYQMHCLHAPEVEQIKTTRQQNTLFHAIQAWLERTPFINNPEFVFWKEYKQAVFDAISHDEKLIQQSKIAAKDEQNQRLKELDNMRERFAAFFDENSYQQLIDKRERRLSFKASTAALFIFLYRSHPVLQLPYQILSSLIAIDELLSSWRSKHLLMVQRMIGAKMGTGGSSGVAYLEIGLRNQVFSDLTSLSTFMVKNSDLPQLPQKMIQELGFIYRSAKEF